MPKLQGVICAPPRQNDPAVQRTQEATSDVRPVSTPKVPALQEEHTVARLPLKRPAAHATLEIGVWQKKPAAQSVSEALLGGQ